MGAGTPTYVDLRIMRNPLKGRKSFEGAKKAMLAPRATDVKDWVVDGKSTK